MRLILNNIPCGHVSTSGKHRFKADVLDIAKDGDTVVAITFVSAITAGDSITMSLKVGKNSPSVRCPSYGIWGNTLPKQEMKPPIVTRLPGMHKNMTLLASKDLNDVRHDTTKFYYSYDKEVDKVELLELIRHKYPVLSAEWADKLYDELEADGRIDQVTGSLDIIGVEIDDLHQVIAKVIQWKFQLV